MSKMIKKIFSSELSRGALILLITINLYNFLNFLFHFSMGRMLGPKEYGTLAALMSLVYIYSIPTEAIQNIITKYTSKFNLKNEKGKIKYLLRKSLKKAFLISLLLFIVLIIIAVFLANFLRINFWLILIMNLIIYNTFA